MPAPRPAMDAVPGIRSGVVCHCRPSVFRQRRIMRYQPRFGNRAYSGISLFPASLRLFGMDCGGPRYRSSPQCLLKGNVKVSRRERNTGIVGFSFDENGKSYSKEFPGDDAEHFDMMPAKVRRRSGCERSRCANCCLRGNDCEYLMPDCELTAARSIFFRHG